jgi:hypothetical protein
MVGRKSRPTAVKKLESNPKKDSVNSFSQIQFLPSGSW